MDNTGVMKNGTHVGGGHMEQCIMYHNFEGLPENHSGLFGSVIY